MSDMHNPVQLSRMRSSSSPASIWLVSFVRPKIDSGYNDTRLRDIDLLHFQMEVRPRVNDDPSFAFLRYFGLGHGEN